MQKEASVRKLPEPAMLQIPEYDLLAKMNFTIWGLGGQTQEVLISAVQAVGTYTVLPAIGKTCNEL